MGKEELEQSLQPTSELKRNKGKNRGEISELYVFLRTLAEGRVYQADSNLNRDDDLYFIVNKILGGSDAPRRSYFVESGVVNIEDDDVVRATVDVKQLDADCKAVSEALDSKTVRGVIDRDVKPISDRYLRPTSMNSSSKTDIVLEIYDGFTGTNLVLPFSIKSFIGNPPTLLNASRQTNFRYRVVGDLSDGDIEEINSLMKKDAIAVKERVARIKEKGCTLEYAGMDSDSFKDNLLVIDSRMPEILAAMLLARYDHDVADISELVQYLNKEDPLGFSGSRDYYRVKISRLLMESFAGMKPSEPWNGIEEVHGGYIVVTPDKQVLCFFMRNRNIFEDYLFNNVKLETSSAKRQGYASIEKEGDDLIFKLNLDIRYKEHAKSVSTENKVKISGQKQMRFDRCQRRFPEPILK